MSASKILFFAAASLALVAAMPIVDEMNRAQTKAAATAANFTGYVVTGQWDGRTIPQPQWAFDITRQDTAWRPTQELVLASLLPTATGPALSPSYSAYEPVSRSYFMSTALANGKEAMLWSYNIKNDVSGATPLSGTNSGGVRYQFPEMGSTLVALEVVAVNAQELQVLAFFNTLTGNCTVLKVDYSTGSTAYFANLCVNFTRQITSAIGQDSATKNIFIIDQASEGEPDRNIITLDGVSGAITQISKLAAVPYHDPLIEIPFDLQWLPNLNTAFVFYTGSENSFDQMMYVYPATGQTIMAMIDLAQYQGDYGGNLEFTENDQVEDDDTWSVAALDASTNKLYFQCSDVDQDSGEVTIAMCQVDIPPHSPAALYYVNIAIEPMTYGYVGMQYVQVVSDK